MPGLAHRFTCTRLAVVLLSIAVSASGIATSVLANAAQPELVVVLPNATEYHRPGCDVVRGTSDVVVMTRADAEARGLKPHPACDPATPPSATDSKKPDAGHGKKAPPQYVYVAPGHAHYHKSTCPKLPKGAKKVPLDRAGLEYWPCPVCKPPIRPRPAHGRG